MYDQQSITIRDSRWMEFINAYTHNDDDNKRWECCSRLINGSNNVCKCDERVHSIFRMMKTFIIGYTHWTININIYFQVSFPHTFTHMYKHTDITHIWHSKRSREWWKFPDSPPPPHNKRMKWSHNITGNNRRTISYNFSTEFILTKWQMSDLNRLQLE